jgi:hypothetical protein
MKIFISYRRSDTEPVALSIRERLRTTPDVRSVFFDHTSIKGGAVFLTAIQRALSRCQAYVILIGPNFLVLNPETGAARLFDDDDVVRMEIETALSMKRGKVLPVLVGEASMPRAESLPESLQRLPTLNAIRLRIDDFDEDMDDLLDAAFGARPRVSRWAIPRLTFLRGILLLAYGLLSTAAVILILALVNRAVFPEAIDLTGTIKRMVGLDSDFRTDRAALTILFIFLANAFILGALAPFLLRSVRQSMKRARDDD